MGKLQKNETGLALILASAIWGMAYFDGIAVIYLLIVMYFMLMFRTKKAINITLNIGTAFFYLSCFFFLFGLLLTNNWVIYKTSTDDTYNMIFLILILIMVNQLSVETYKDFFNRTKKISLFLLSLLSILALYKYYSLAQGIYLPQYFNANGHYIFGTSLIADNNMFALSMLIGLIFGVSLIVKSKSVRLKILYSIAITPILMTIVFSGSRRSFVILSLICVILILKLLKDTLIKMRIAKVLIGTYFVCFGLMLILIIYHFSGYEISVKDIINDPQIQTTIERFQSISPSNATESFLPRTDRWGYSWELISNSNLFQMFFGRGFDYLHLYLVEFPSEAKEDYPHNPVLSALLYSGLIGMVVVIGLISFSFYNLIKYVKFLGVEFAIVYTTTFIFIMISGNSIFTYKLFLILSSFTILARTIFAEATKETVAEKTRVKNKVNFEQAIEQ
ncbi:O-antigen ligase family protein [Psychrobacillus sp. BM2]|uniref:O-antigen ligase family protein n=1 Tax=Psychrobacillus sp. BM2 TaxID=3400421 RepID=UPI003B01E596